MAEEMGLPTLQSGVKTLLDNTAAADISKIDPLTQSEVKPIKRPTIAKEKILTTQSSGKAFIQEMADII